MFFFHLPFTLLPCLLVTTCTWPGRMPARSYFKDAARVQRWKSHWKLKPLSPVVLDSNILLMEEILHQLIGSLSQYLQGFIHARWCRISFINIMLHRFRFVDRLLANEYCIILDFGMIVTLCRCLIIAEFDQNYDNVYKFQVFLLWFSCFFPTWSVSTAKS